MDPAFGKTASKWITDFEALETKLRSEDGYSASFASSLTLSLEEFYNIVQHCAVSAIDGYGFKDYEKLVENAAMEYETSYLQLYEKMKVDYEKTVTERKENDLARFRKDFHTGKRDEVFSMQATSTLCEGIDLLPRDDDDISTSESEEEFDGDKGGTIGDFRTQESKKRDKKITVMGSEGQPQI